MYEISTIGWLGQDLELERPLRPELVIDPSPAPGPAPYVAPYCPPCPRDQFVGPIDPRCAPCAAPSPLPPGPTPGVAADNTMLYVAAAGAVALLLGGAYFFLRR